MTKEIKATEIETGMILKTANTDKIVVERVEAKWGAVQVGGFGQWTGLGQNETVQVIGYFNPEA